MNSKMFRFTDKLKIINRIIQLVSIYMVDSHSARDWPSRLLPNVMAIQNPFIWFGNLNVLTLFAAAFSTCANTNRTNCVTVMSGDAASELTFSVAFHDSIIPPNYVGDKCRF